MPVSPVTRPGPIGQTKEDNEANDACLRDTCTRDSISNGKSVASQVTKDTGTSPGRIRRNIPPPPLPRRADFGEHYPDGGWGWVVCGAAFIVHFLSHGFHLAFGTMLAEILKRYRTRETSTVWLGPLSFGLALILSPLVTAICRRKSPRLYAVVGGLIASLGCLFMSFSTQLHQLFISQSLIIGLGSGITMATSSIMISRYFQRRRECAEMLVLSGSGAGMAVLSVFVKQVMGLLNWMRAMQTMAGLMALTVVGGSLYRSASLYHPRRRAILHIKNQKKTKKQRKDEKPPYFDFSPMRMRAIQMLMVIAGTASLGSYTPFVLLTKRFTSNNVEDTSVCLLMVFLGIGFAFGVLGFGMVVIHSSLRCMVARQYLCQMSVFGAGFVTLLFTMAEGFDAFALYVWAYGLMCGAFHYSIKVYVYEIVTTKLSERAWGFVVFSQSFSTLMGTPIAVYLDNSFPDAKPGFLFAGAAMVMASAMLFLMPWATRHTSNYEVIQNAHLKTKTFDSSDFYGMEISDDMSNKPLNNFHYVFRSPSQLRKPLTEWKKSPNYRAILGTLGHISEEEHRQDIEALSPMSSADKVKDFLVKSQTLLQNYNQLSGINVPDVKLEITNDFTSSDGDETSHYTSLREITDLRLEGRILSDAAKCYETKRRWSTGCKELAGPSSSSRNVRNPHSPPKTFVRDLIGQETDKSYVVDTTAV